MGLLNPFMVKQTYAAADLTLEAKSGKSLLVLDIRVVNPVANWLTVKIAQTTVGYFRCGGDLGNHLGMGAGTPTHSHGLTVAAADGALTEDHALSNAYGVSNANLAITSDLSALTTVANMVGFGGGSHSAYETILAYLRRKGMFNGYPVGEGQTLTLSGVNQAGCLQQIIYAEFDAADMQPTMPNGSESTEYLLLNYGRTAAVITTSTSTIFDTRQTPAEFPNFPFAKDVPAKMEIDLLGILASDIVFDLGSADCMNSDYLKFVRERVTLFDEDKNGLFMKGVIGNTSTVKHIAKGISMLGNYSDKDNRPPFILDPIITFEAGEELGVYISTTAGGSQSSSDLAVADTEICLIERIRKIG